MGVRTAQVCVCVRTSVCATMGTGASCVCMNVGVQMCLRECVVTCMFVHLGGCVCGGGGLCVYVCLHRYGCM